MQDSSGLHFGPESRDARETGDTIDHPTSSHCQSYRVQMYPFVTYGLINFLLWRRRSGFYTFPSCKKYRLSLFLTYQDRHWNGYGSVQPGSHRSPDWSSAKKAGPSVTSYRMSRSRDGFCETALTKHKFLITLSVFQNVWCTVQYICCI